MFHDARTLDEGTEIRADVCIVGAGAAGIALTRELAARSLRVVLLESGGRTFDREVQRLYAGRNVGRPSHSPYASRIRQFGGSTTQWSGMCRPLEKLDFEEQIGIPHSGWPIGWEELEPYYRRAHETCKLGPYDYEPRRWASDELPLFDLDEKSLLAPRIYQFSHPLDFGEAYGSELASLDNVDVYLHANVLEVDADPEAGRVGGVQVASAVRRRFRVTAEHVVLAAGGLENPRLLLASNRRAKDGIGNQHGLVGRFFNDHPFFFLGRYEPVPGAPEQNLHTIEDYGRMGWDQRALAAFSLSDRILAHERLNACVVFLVRRPSHKASPSYFLPARRSVNRLIDLAGGRDVSDGPPMDHVVRTALGLPAVARSLASHALDRFRPRTALALRATLETTPNPDSRVSLAPERDRFGVPRVTVDWRLNPGDQRGLTRTLEAMREEFHRLGLGRVITDIGVDDEGWPHSMTGGKHHMGTTRMHEDPRRGVVDAHCRVHGYGNLHVAGSSVFPTGGVANPTLTIVALAIRLADHLSLALRSGREG